MNKIRQNKLGINKLSSLSVDLLKEGYTESEIDMAFTWLFEKVDISGRGMESLCSPLPHTPYRQLNYSEKLVIRPAAHGYLLQLRSLDLIDDAQMEQIIEQAMLLGDNSVDREDIEDIVAVIMFDIHISPEEYNFNNRQIAH